MPSLLLLSHKRYHADFRKYLMRAAERAGARALHIYCWEQIILACNGSEMATFPTNVDEQDVLRLVRENLGGDRVIVLTGLGCHEASLAARLQRILENAVLVYDVYDDLLFNAGGVNRAV